MAIKQILFVGILIISIIYITKVRNFLIDRVILALLMLIGILFIIFPNFTSVIANAIGIGRGADLVFYLFIFSTLFIFFYLLSKMNKLNRDFTEFVRKDAIRNVAKANELEQKNPETKLVTK